MSELWQVVARIDDERGRSGIGLGTQSVLWSDATVFERLGGPAGNALMFQLTAHALRECEGETFGDPRELLDRLFPSVLAHGEAMTGGKLRPTFVLNALVPVDNAAWQLHAAR
ncbi:MAG: L-alanine-DL-glutamate epimerase, partial [Opitutaceae bacterium]